jgi:uncharacterized damage-inducible protein DinB
MNVKEVLIEQFKACYNETNWFVTAETALAGLTSGQADWKAEHIDNTIREEVAHLSFWNERWLKRLRGETLEDAPANDETFRNEIGWETVKANFFRVMNDWQEALSEMDEAEFGETVSAEHDEPWSSPIANINVHNAYHIGQIVFIRKLQGSWDPAKGVS